MAAIWKSPPSTTPAVWANASADRDGSGTVARGARVDELAGGVTPQEVWRIHVQSRHAPPCRARGRGALRFSGAMRGAAFGEFSPTKGAVHCRRIELV